MRLLIARFFLFPLLWCSSLQAEEMYHVAVAQIVEHPALDTLREGLKDALNERGYIEGQNLVWTYENAQGNPATAIQIAHKLKSLKPSVIVTLSTPMTQAALSSISKIPIVFGAVTDPQAAKISGHDNVTGLTDRVPANEQITLIKDILPNLKTLGLIYNPGEANSLDQVEQIKAVCLEKGINVRDATVSKSSEVPAATKNLVTTVDAILLPTDNTAITAIDAILKISKKSKIPVFGSDTDIVKRGALAAYGVDWRESGYALAEMVNKILKGQPVDSIPIEPPQSIFFYINTLTAREIGLDIPDNLVNKANFVF